MARLIFTLVILLAIGNVMFAQTSFSGKVTDGTTKEIVIGATVRLFKGSTFVEGASTNEVGTYRMSNVDPGTYRVEVSNIGYQSYIIEKMDIIGNRANVENFVIYEDSKVLGPVDVTARRVKLIEQDNTTQGQTFTSSQIAKVPVRSIDGLVAASAGVSSANGSALSIRGSRTNGVRYMVDGIIVSGGYLPPSEIDQLQVITGGLEAQYGDVTGGFISATTKGPSDRLSIYLDGETSKFLDPWERSEVNAAISGPIYKNSNGQSVVGFRLSGRYIHHLDDDPSYSDLRYMKTSAISKLGENPVTRLENGTTFPSGEFNITDNSEYSRIRRNQQNTNYDLNGKLDFRVSNAITLQIGGGYTDNKNLFTPGDNDVNGRSWDFANYQRNPTNFTNRYRGNVRLRHRISGGANEEKGILRNVSYTLIGGYEKIKSNTYDPIHKDNLFDYGYIGKAHTTFRPGAQLVDTTDNPFFIQVPEFGSVDSIPLEIGSQNPVLANYNTFSFDETDNEKDGLVIFNGRSLSNYNDIFGMYSNVGQIYNVYRKSENDTYTGRLDINFDLGPRNSEKGIHSVTLGVIHEQQVNRFYAINPRGLWIVANNDINLNLTTLDSSSVLMTDYYDPITGVVLDTVYNMKSVDVEGKGFYRRFREANNIPMNQWLDINNFTPDQMRLDMFAPEDLTSSNLINFYGYDYLGNKVNNAGFNEFFTATTTNNVRTMLLAPFKPIYQSFYIQDKFQAKEVIVRAGLRVEKYDANTKVLKDDYSLYPMLTADKFFDLPGTGDKPANIDGNSFVYLAGATDATGVGAYRLGDKWFDKNGLEYSDPRLLFNEGFYPRYDLVSGEVKPDIQKPGYDPNRSFKDYDPQITFSPRLAISFPISEFANFFGHYDILVQRPSNNYASALDFYTWNSQTQFNSPNLKPEKNIDYEVGFQQMLNKSSALKLSAYYKEVRDLIQRSLITYTNNATTEMLQFRNIDFSTIKGLQVQYDLRRTGNFSLQANYTFQMADGTGSDAETQRNIAKNGSIRILSPLNFDERHAFKLIMDFRYDKGKRYNGPVWFGKDVFSDAGINVLASAVSGRPYTSDQEPGQFGSSIPIGKYNGARFPWNYNVDLRIDKAFNLNPKNEKHPLSMIVYLRVTNLLNTRNIFNLYKASKSPDNDGYLVSDRGQSAFISITEAPSAIERGRTVDDYLNAYHWRLYNPDFFNGPRRIFVGANFNF